MKSGFSTGRDVLLFIAGLAIIAHEVITGTYDSGALILGGSLVGLPAFLPKDSK